MSNNDDDNVTWWQTAYLRASLWLSNYIQNSKAPSISSCRSQGAPMGNDQESRSKAGATVCVKLSTHSGNPLPTKSSQIATCLVRGRGITPFRWQEIWSRNMGEGPATWARLGNPPVTTQKYEPPGAIERGVWTNFHRKWVRTVPKRRLQLPGAGLISCATAGPSAPSTELAHCGHWLNIC